MKGTSNFRQAGIEYRALPAGSATLRECHRLGGEATARARAGTCEFTTALGPRRGEVAKANAKRLTDHRLAALRALDHDVQVGRLLQDSVHMGRSVAEVASLVRKLDRERSRRRSAEEAVHVQEVEQFAEQNTGPSVNGPV